MSLTIEKSHTNCTSCQRRPLKIPTQGAYFSMHLSSDFLLTKKSSLKLWCKKSSQLFRSWTNWNLNCGSTSYEKKRSTKTKLLIEALKEETQMVVSRNSSLNNKTNETKIQFLAISAYQVFVARNGTQSLTTEYLLNSRKRLIWTLMKKMELIILAKTRVDSRKIKPVCILLLFWSKKFNHTRNLSPENIISRKLRLSLFDPIRLSDFCCG